MTTEQPKYAIYELVMLGLCVYVLTALGFSTFVSLDESVQSVLMLVDNAVCVVFLKTSEATMKCHLWRAQTLDYKSSDQFEIDYTLFVAG